MKIILFIVSFTVLFNAYAFACPKCDSFPRASGISRSSDTSHTFSNGLRITGSEEFPGYPVGVAIDNGGNEPLMVITDGFLEYRGKRISIGQLDKMLKIINRWDETIGYIFEVIEKVKRVLSIK